MYCFSLPVIPVLSDQSFPRAIKDPDNRPATLFTRDSLSPTPVHGGTSLQMGEGTGSRLLTTLEGMRYAVREPSWKELHRVAFVSGVPFVGFGMMDNAIMIIVSFLPTARGNHPKMRGIIIFLPE